MVFRIASTKNKGLSSSQTLPKRGISLSLSRSRNRLSKSTRISVKISCCSPTSTWQPIDHSPRRYSLQAQLASPMKRSSVSTAASRC